ncbi:MAG: hypothetical protein EA399_06895 [Desulfovibrionales bacterium]|nr:MAG: hypothetical protein EA399_06895 [Desulfovibrionales bacterium]
MSTSVHLDNPLDFFFNLKQPDGSLHLSVDSRLSDFLQCADLFRALAQGNALGQPWESRKSPVEATFSLIHQSPSPRWRGFGQGLLVG